MEDYNELNKIFLDFDKHLMQDPKPSIYFKEFYQHDVDNYFPFNIISKLKSIDQSPQYHPEGNVFNHTMLVVDNAAKLKGLSEDKQVFMWTSLLHDIGKITTTKVRKGRITSYEHDKQGAKFARIFLEYCTQDQKLINKVPEYVYFHMQPLYVYKHLPFAKISKMEDSVPIKDIALFCICDRKGRGNIDRKAEKNIYDTVLYFLDICMEKINNSKQIELILELKNRINNL